MTIKMIAPAGTVGIVQGRSGTSYTVGSDRSISNVNNQDVLALLGAGWSLFGLVTGKVAIRAPRVADLIYVKAAATPANGAITIANQPDQARKLAVRIVIGTPTTTAITAGTLTLVGTDQDGNAITEVISLIATSSKTVNTANAYASLTSGTVAGYAAAGSGTGNTLGLGQAADLGCPTAPGAVDFVLLKATKIVSTFTGSGTAVTTVSILPVDDVASTATVDAAARTVSPTTAPGATATTATDYEFTYAYSAAA
jgi:hypothetical protein